MLPQSSKDPWEMPLVMHMKCETFPQKRKDTWKDTATKKEWGHRINESRKIEKKEELSLLAMSKII